MNLTGEIWGLLKIDSLDLFNINRATGAVSCTIYSLCSGKLNFSVGSICITFLNCVFCDAESKFEIRFFSAGHSFRDIGKNSKNYAMDYTNILQGTIIVTLFFTLHLALPLWGLPFQTTQG